MAPSRRPAGLAAAGLAALALVAAVGCGPTAMAPAPPPSPPPPTTCYLRASGDNAVIEVTGVDAARGCREFQSWSLKTNASRVLEWSDARPDPSTLKMPLWPSDEEYRNKAPAIKETCRYTLGAFTYSVTDSGAMSIGQGWCRELYGRAVKAG